MNLDEYKEKKMLDSEFAQAYNESQPEMSVIRDMIDNQTSQNLTRKIAQNGQA